MLILLLSSVVHARTALVIGNSEYKTAPLTNPVNDATDIARALDSLDFEVTVLTNASRRSMRRAIRDYSEQLRRSGDVGLFYYAGHGMQIDGINYLIPVDAVMRNEFEIPDEAVAANSVLRALEEAGNDLNIVILDACRDNPFAKSYRSAATRGLARMDAPGGSIIAYATAPGDVALDGNGRNGVYTKHLLNNMEKPGMPIEQMFKKVRIGVIDESGGQQTPWEESSLRSDFYFLPAKIYEVDIPSQPESATELTSQRVEPISKPESAEVAAMTPQREAAISANLRKAKQAMLEDRLTTPVAANAVYFYRETLKLDPVNLDAHEGLQRITQRYIGLAEREIARNNPERAQQFVARGLDIQPTNIRLQDLRLQSEEMKILQVKSRQDKKPTTSLDSAPVTSAISTATEQTDLSTMQGSEDSNTTAVVRSSRMQEQKEAFKEDVEELTNSIKGLGNSIKGGFKGLFRKKSNPTNNN
ncbi:MAG: caspase family protein [Granulosicoccus sp.]|nr:caspase family protein [Granulosicoccus sp.]